jgi:hypothetical protein
MIKYSPRVDEDHVIGLFLQPVTSVCCTVAIIRTMKAELCIIFAHHYPNRTHRHMNHHRPRRYLHHHRHHHHDQNVCTFLCTFLSMTILTNAAIAGALHARAEKDDSVTRTAIPRRPDPTADDSGHEWKE